MKINVLFILCLALAFRADAQSYRIEPSATIVADVPVNLGGADYQINIHNLTSSKLSVSWYLVKNTYPTGWDYSLCDYGTCFIGVPSFHTMDSITIGNSGFLKINLNPSGLEGSGEVQLAVYESSNPTVIDTLVYHINASLHSGIASAPAASAFAVYPNPAKEVLHIDARGQHPSLASVYSLDGRELMRQPVDATGLLDLGMLPQGNYFLLITDTQNHVFRQPLIRE